MKLGIVTFTYGDNYGQRLQNYAVQEVLKTYADEVCTIPQKKRFVSKKSLIKGFLKKSLTGKLLSEKRRHKAFTDFDERYINYHCDSVENEKLCGEETFDFFSVGSDQVWSPYSKDVNSSMFLTFTTPEKRIAFSPSIAAAEIPEEKKELYRQYWEGFAYLSVREQRSAELICELTGRKAEVLIDPTMMISPTAWRSIAEKPKQTLPERYAVFYYLGESQEIQHLQSYCREHQIGIINLMRDSRFLVMGPSEFLYLIDHAELVVTDSFHGTIFSILFHTPFIICERSGSSVDMSSRFETLYNKFEIADRKLTMCSLTQIHSVDFSQLDECIRREQNKVTDYLDKCLGNQNYGENG